MYGNSNSIGRSLRLLPHLFEQEAAANRHLLAILFKLYTGDDADNDGGEVKVTDEKESGLVASIESHCDEKTSRIMERESDMTTQLLKNVITAKNKKKSFFVADTMC